MRRVNRRQFLGIAGATTLAGLAAACGAGSSSAPARSPAAVPEPTGWIVTRWRRDPFARGSYSYLGAGATPADRATLARPIGQRLHLAGEATSVDSPSTVHGALLSGRRAARQIMDRADGGSVVVVGAGAAGLAATRALADEGFDVTVLEARERTGGRIWTSDRLGTPLDLGASWIHGVDGNPLTEIADDLDVERVPTDYDNVVIYDDAGRPTEVDEGALQTAAAALAADVGATEPFGPAITPQLAALDRSERVELEFLITSTIETEYATNIENLTPLGLDEGEDLGGGDVTFPDGYAQLLVGATDGASLRTGFEVRQIEVSEDGVLVDGPAGSVRGDAALVTLPIGVLRAGAVRFAPALPAPVTQAIDRIAMGVLDKAYLRFPRIFWDPDLDGFGYVSPERGLWVEWLNMAKITGEPILVGFNAGSVAERLEAWSDRQVVASAMDTLRTIYG